jgi:hypothetical protein
MKKGSLNCWIARRQNISTSNNDRVVLLELYKAAYMTNAIQSAVLSACQELMKPIVRLLLKNGIGYREFSELWKATFVDVASSDYGIRGRKTNMSRVAVMTGLSRKEVKKVRTAIQLGSFATPARIRRPELILSIWHTDQEFLDKSHRPKRIRFDGPGPSFRDLVSRVGGDIPPKAMLNELLRAGAIVVEGEKLRAVSRSYVPEPHDPDAIFLAGEAIRDLMSTIEHNLNCQDPALRYFERRVYSLKLPASHRLRFRKLAREKGELLLRDFNSWLSEREGSDLSDEVQAKGDYRLPGIGVGIYFFDHMHSQNSKPSAE